ncbi:MAG: restriction endonuclease, partial [Deltaproteobacteria bacterium]|nr:restriction endonuclease [Deltaproteobacteria bacterium]
RIGAELAKVRTGEDQPSPAPLRQAIRDVIKSCIYGVDKNRLAVELCKVSLWLEAHNPGEPLNFLDHHIKCGDAIVGLAHKEELENGIADEAFKKMPDDDKDIRAELAKRNKRERKDRKQRHFDFGKTVEGSFADISMMFDRFNRLPESTIEEIEYKRKEYVKMSFGAKWLRLKALADIQVAQFFIPKDETNVRKIVTDEEYMDYLSGTKPIHPMKVGRADGVTGEKRFFHWFLEFPVVFAGGGFDCILGNPPYLGGKRISGIYGNEYLSWLKFNFAPAGGLTDLVAYFLRRIDTIIAKNKFLSIITTNTIAQGDTREGGLGFITKKGNIVFAIKSIKWPGVANLEVSLIALVKGKWAGTRILNNGKVDFINSYFGDSEDIGSTYLLQCKKNICFQGSVILGTGFILENNKKQEILNIDSKYENIIFPYLIGDDINNDIEQKPSRYVINFFDWPEDKAKEYTECYNIVKNKVYPERQEKKDKGYRTRWWQFGRRSVNLYSKISKFQRVIVTSRVTKYLNFSFVPNNYVYDVGTNAILIDKYSGFLILQSSLNEAWSRKYGSSLRFDLRYTNSDCFENFPFPQNLSDIIEMDLDQTGSQFYEHRHRLMLKMKVGLTKTYNQFHNPDLREFSNDDIAIISTMKDKEFQKQYGKETVNLWKHLKKTEGVYTFNEAVKHILHLRELHKQMDETVLKAYCWEDIDLAHDFYEVDYLPENDRVRYTISPDARKEVLKRLLKLNHEIHEQEVKAGLYVKRKSKKKQKADASGQMKLF